MLGMNPQMQAEMEIYVKNIRSKRMDMAFHREPLEGMWWLSFKKIVTSISVGFTHLHNFISTQTYRKGNQGEGHQVEKVMSHGTKTKQRC